MRLPNGALILLLGLVMTALPYTVAGTGSRTIYLPLIIGQPGGPPLAVGGYRVNVPHFAVADVDSKFGELAIFWFGKVTPDQNYADVRIGHNDAELYIYLAIFDRRIWYNPTPSAATLNAWDAVTLYLDTEPGAALDASSYRFVAQFGEDSSPAYRASYRASGGNWASASIPFTTRPGWRGDRLNDDTDDRGWAMAFRIPFSSLGLSGRPSGDNLWRMALVLHDRDSRAGPPLADQIWPPEANLAAPTTWGTLRFGMPSYTPPATANQQTFTIRHGLRGVVVPDAAVGGGSICGDGLDFWSEWGNSTRDAGKPDFNIQNQSDIADWPCFSKYFVTFPLDALPTGRAVVEARLVLHQFGNSEPSQAKPSFIQVLTVGADWSERTLSWNNAPLATENFGGAWVEPLRDHPGWPGVRREWDVSRAVAQAYAAGGPLRLAMYSADSDYHSGKYFVSSDTEDWNADGRPTLIVRLGTAR